jgi:isocitrate/isopropylmalate dehydrogenase
MLLDHLGEAEAARQVEHAVKATLAAGATLTPDLGGSAKTVEVSEAVSAWLSR